MDGNPRSKRENPRYENKVQIAGNARKHPTICALC